MYVDEYLALSDEEKEQEALKNKRDANLLTIAGGGAIKGLSSFGGLALSLPEFLVRSAVNKYNGEEEHPYLKAFVESTGNKYANKFNNWLDEKVGIPEYEDMSFGQRLADFTGTALPIFRVGKFAGMLGKSTSRAAQKAVLNNARNAAKNLGKNSAEVLKDLKNTKDMLRPTSSLAEYIVPGYQIPTKNVLAYELRQKGLTGWELQDAIRRSQLASLGIQAGIDAGFQEGMASLMDSQGLFLDHSKKKDLAEIENEAEIQKADEKINWTKNAATIAAIGLGTYGGYRFVKTLTKNRYADVANRINNRIDVLKDTEKFMPNKDINSLSAQTFDKLDIIDDLPYKDLITDETRDILRTDATATQATMLSTPELVRGEYNVPINTLNDKLIDLGKVNPADLQLLDDFADAHMRLSNYNNIVDKKNIKHLPSKVVKQLIELKKDFTDKLNLIKNNDQLYKFLLDLSNADKQLLKATRKSNNISENTYQRLLRNRDIDGIFLYKRALSEVENGETSIIDKVLYKNSNKIGKTNNIVQERTKFNLDPDKQYVPYSQDFYKKYLDYTHMIINNGASKKGIEDIMSNTPEYLQNLVDFLGYDMNMTDKDLIKKAVKDIDNRVRVKYLADIKYDTSLKDSINIHDNPYSLLNTIDDASDAEKFMIKNKTRISDKDALKYLEQALNDPNSKYIALPNGNDGYALYEADYYIKKALQVSPDVLSLGEEMVKFSRNMFQSATTGNLNPFFAPKSALFNTFEALAALPRIFDALNEEFTVKEYFNYLYYQTKATKDYIRTRFIRDTIENIEKPLQKDGIDAITQETLQQALENNKAKLDKVTLSRFERQGAIAFAEANSRNINEELVNSTPFRQFTNKMYGKVRGNKILKTLLYIMESLRNSGNNGLLLQMATKKGVEKLSEEAATKIVRRIGRVISTSVTDSKQVGIYESLAGRIAGVISKNLPYGNIMIKSIASKLRDLNISDGIRFTKAALNEIKKSDHKMIDTIISLQMGAKELKNNKYIQGLVATIAVPTTICYLWNHSSSENREEYYRLSDYDKASKLMLVNFFGKGKHLAIPGDQEVMVVGKLFETLLDNMVGGSSIQETDPAFQQSNLIMQAMARSLDISNFIYPEAALNLAGFRSNLGAENITGDPVIKKLPRNVQNLDGSETAVQNGLLSQETRALLNTLGGALMTSLGNSAEQFNIGNRDASFTQGLKDFGTSFMDQNLRQLPGIPFIRSFVYRATNQTSLENKKMRENIDKLKALISNDKRGGAYFGNRKDTKIPNLAYIQPNSPEINNMLVLAQQIVPMYNKNIMPLYDKVGALYKQLNAFNATGRDFKGNVIDTRDRFEFQQKINIELQNLQKTIYTQYKLIEKQLTKETGKNILLSDLKTLQ